MTDTPLPSLSDIDTTPTSLVEEDLNTPFSNPSLSADTLTNQDALTADTLNANPPTGNTPLSPNIFMDNSTPEPSPESDKDDKQKFVSKYIRRFTFASIITVINIVLI
ncbi:MAG: hypothetical protein LBP53_00235 [Candidatus Peribacteria bacterium]|jgi:hypothetical protein|nr:hypothetical protein [Candidatus Peribacteria bacterium]